MKIDTRAGSNELIVPLRRLGVPVDAGILPAGDVEILGNGPEGRPVTVGVEYKTVEDAVGCMRSGRFAEQLREMQAYYEVKWLLIEGRMSAGRFISVHRGNRWFEIPGKVTYQEFAAWLSSMVQRGGVLLYRTENQSESVQWLRSLELWWTAKDWEEHRAHMALYTPPTDSENPFNPPSLACRVAAVLPHIGSVKAERVAQHFGSVRKMIDATPEEWQAIKGIGKGISKKLIEALEEEK